MTTRLEYVTSARWSAENETGEWYAEKSLGPKPKWRLEKLRGKGRGCYGKFRSLAAVNRHLAAMESAT